MRRFKQTCSNPIYNYNSHILSPEEIFIAHRKAELISISRLFVSISGKFEARGQIRTGPVNTNYWRRNIITHYPFLTLSRPIKLRASKGEIAERRVDASTYFTLGLCFLHQFQIIILFCKFIDFVLLERVRKAGRQIKGVINYNKRLGEVIIKSLRLV